MTPASASKSLLLLLTCALLGACSQWDYELGSPLAEIRQADTGPPVTRAEALETLGPPLHMSATTNGYVMAWEYWQLSESSIGIGLGMLGAELLNLDWGKLQASGEFLMLTFDTEHRVTSSSRSQWNDKAGGGVAVQPLASFLSVVESDDLRDSMYEHLWGADLLQAMPTGLNRQSSSRTGQNGIEQRGTPSTVGQRSLEMN